MHLQLQQASLCSSLVCKDWVPGVDCCKYQDTHFSVEEDHPV